MEDRKPILFCIHLNQDDPRKNTALRLAKFGLVEIRKKIKMVPRKAIILDPFATEIISEKDYETIKNFGITVIDCSWEKTESVFFRKFTTGRKLPHLLAANSVNYGKWDRLSSAEALAAALYLTGFQEMGQEILTKFSWGDQFWIINRENLKE